MSEDKPKRKRPDRAEARKRSKSTSEPSWKSVYRVFWFRRVARTLFAPNLRPSSKMFQKASTKRWLKSEGLKLNPVFRSRNPALKGAIWLVESIFHPIQWTFSPSVLRFFICGWNRHTQKMLFVRKRQRLARFFQNPANQVTVFIIIGYGRKHWV